MTTRVVLADDSDIAAAMLEAILEADPEIRVVGRARTGAEIFSMPAASIADVVLVDLLMPELDGLSVIRALAAHAAILVVTSLPRDSAVVREALAQGASDTFTKRELADPRAQDRLRAAVRAAAHRPRPHAMRGAHVVAVAGSTGAIPALEALARGCAPLAVPVLVVQHLPDQRERDLARALSSLGAPARPARAGELLAPELLLAPSGVHLEVDGRDRVRLSSGDPVNGHRPSADVLFRSLVPIARRTIGIVLSGLGQDGAAGLGELASAGGLCFAQDPAECSAPDMPRAALAASPLVRAARIQEFIRFAQKVVTRDG